MLTSEALSSVATAPGPFVEARDGTRLYWTQWGTGPRTGARAVSPILFLSSAGMSAPMWDYQMTAFADQGHRCIAFDRRGHGRSDLPAEGYDFDTLADDVDSVITALDLENLTVVTHSMAAGEIVRYLTRHGSGRVARIALIAPTTPCLMRMPDNPDGLPQAVFEALRASWRLDFQKWIADNTAPFFVPDTSPAMMQWVAGLLMQCPVQVAIACNRALTTTDFRADLARISVPAMVIHGDQDASAPFALTAKPTADRIPGCRLHLYRGAPHGLIYTHMERVIEDLLGFIWDT
jgi:non-heme chloroperoxidase